ncbi:MAG TPA: hypothetical protein VEH76_10575 [Methylocystis sp.]|nr:hypothetical protein [Methylocystis sp.]
MARDDDDLPLRGGSRVQFGRQTPAEAAPEIFRTASSSSWGRQLMGALTVSIAVGSVAGYVYGGRTGVSEGAAAGARRELTAGADPSSAREAETLRLLDDVRGLRAQVEQLRHGAEAQRAAADETGALGAELREVLARLDRLERAAADKTPVGAIPSPTTDARARAKKAKPLGH